MMVYKLLAHRIGSRFEIRLVGPGLGGRGHGRRHQGLGGPGGEGGGGREDPRHHRRDGNTEHGDGL